MKKFLILLFFITSIFLLSSCGKSELTFDKASPNPIVINIEGELKEITVTNTSKTFEDKVTEFEDVLSEGVVTLGSVFFTNYSPDTYDITVSAKKNYKITVKVSGDDAKFTMIKKKEIFDINEDRYYVLFSRSGCANCALLRPDLIVFNNFLNSYPSGLLDNLYVVDYTDPEMETSKGTSTEYTGISSYEELINDVSLSTPTLLVIENGAVLDYYVNASNISSFMYIEMSNIQKEYIIHNIDDPKQISIPLDFTPTRYKVSSSEDEGLFYRVNDYVEGSNGFDGSNMIFAQYTFDAYFPGIYTLTIANKTETKDVTLIIKSEFKYISIVDIFNQEEESYYVFFLRDGCSGCASVKPTLLRYSQYYDRYDSEQNYPLYAIHRSMNSELNTGTPEFFIGAKEYNEIKLGYYPRVLLIQNHEVVDCYKNEGSQIRNHFTQIMSKLK